jgi:TolB-like protein/Tfp pilus assembly protein PilF
LLSGFLAELKRRHVIRVAGVYTVAAWGVFQVVKTILETLDLPKWTSTLALVLLVLGLPVVLVVSWIFERNTKGELVVTPDAPEGKAPQPRLSRWDMLLLAAMVVVVGLAGAQIGGYLGGGKATILGVGAPDKSVAVLPFVMFSAQKDSDYFADGLTEEVINSLAQVPDLKVAGRTSAFYFKGRNEDLREVGKRLGVAHVVEGSVRREGDRLRVTAQLIIVKDGFHIWSKTYDRRMDDAFAIQSEIGAAVAEALKTKLDMKGKAAGLKRDPAAYQLEITSRAHLRRRGLEDLQAARAGFQQLMTLEPENAAAYAGYARSTITLAQNHINMDFGEAQRVSEAAIDKALKLAPNSSDVWLARATVNRTLGIRIGGTRYDKAFDESVRKAVALDPRNSEALTLLAIRLAETGQPAEALTAARKAVAADPLSRSALMASAKSLRRVGKLDEAERQYRAVTELYPDFSEAGYELGMTLVEAGRFDLAEPWLKAAAAQGTDPFIAFQAAWLYTNLGLLEDSHKVLAAIKDSPGKELGQTSLLADRHDWAGLLAFGDALQAKSKEPFWPIVSFQAAAMLGRNEEALANVRKVRPDLLTPEPGVAVTDIDMPILVAHVLRRTGDNAQASRLLDRVLAVTAPVNGARTPNDWRIARAKAFGERGQVDASVEEVRAAAKAGWRAGYGFNDSLWLDETPYMVSVRNDPRFKSLMTRVRQDLAKQRAAVLAQRR